jgi:hypothetical protein
MPVKGALSCDGGSHDTAFQKLNKSDIREQRLDQVRLVKKQEVKTRDDMVNLAQDAQACSGELLRVLRVLRLLG